MNLKAFLSTYVVLSIITISTLSAYAELERAPRLRNSELETIAEKSAYNHHGTGALPECAVVKRFRNTATVKLDSKDFVRSLQVLVGLNYVINIDYISANSDEDKASKMIAALYGKYGDGNSHLEGIFENNLSPNHRILIAQINDAVTKRTKENFVLIVAPDLEEFLIIGKAKCE